MKLDLKKTTVDNESDFHKKLLEYIVTKNQSDKSDDEIELKTVFEFCYRNKWKTILCSACFAVLSYIYAVNLPEIYKSQALVLPNNNEQNNGVGSSVSGQFGGLAALAGINLGKGFDKTKYTLQVLESREFLYKVIDKYKLKENIYAVNGWERDSNRFTYDETIYDAKDKAWIRDISAPFEPEPSLNEVYHRFLKDNFTVSIDEDTGVISISIFHYSPVFAKKIVDLLILEINATIKQQDISEATKSIQYLVKELESTDVSGMRTMFYNLIEQHEKTLMLAKVRNDYALKAIDKAVVPEVSESPNKTIIIIAASIIGYILSLLLIALYGVRRVE